jgi:1,4-dihydroxy-2-naphthoate octaprenyltransferase
MRSGIDLETERTPFSGGSGTLPAGEMSLGAALVFGIGCAVVGLVIGIYFWWMIGSAMLPIIVIGAVCVLAYTDLLARMGIGEVAAGIGLGGGPVVGTALVNTGQISATALAAGIPATLMTFNLLLLNEFPDEEPDRKGGRRNLVILLGRRSAAVVYAAAGLATPLFILGAVIVGHLPSLCLVAMLPSLLLAKPLAWVASDPSAPVPVPAMGSNVIWNLATNTLLAIALVASAMLSG